MSLSKETLGKRISNARKEKCMTQAELSEKIGLSEKYLSRIEGGKQVPSIIVVAKICEALSVSVDNLISQYQIPNYNSIYDEIVDFSIDEQKRIIEIIKIIKSMKNIH